MKKICVGLALILALSGCGKATKDQENKTGEVEKTEEIKNTEEKQKSIKLDENKDYAYVLEESPYTLGNLTAEDTGDFIQNVFQNTYGMKDPLKSQKIGLNIDSVDARRVEEELSGMYQEQVSKVRYTENGNLAEGAGLVLYQVVDNEKTISISMINYGYIMFSDGFGFQMKSYVFDKESGKQLSNDQIFETMNTSQTDITRKIKEYCDSNNLFIDDGSVEWDPSQEGPTPVIVNENSYFVTKDNKIQVELQNRAGIGSPIPIVITLYI